MDTPMTDPDSFTEKMKNGNGAAYVHKNGMVFAEDTAHCNHYDVYKNKGDF